MESRTAEMALAARNVVASVFCGVGLPGALVSDRDTRFASAFQTGLHAAARAPSASLIIGAAHLP